MNDREQKLKGRIRELEESKSAMIDYLKLKVTLQDWHAVMDASCDIREIDSELKALNKIINTDTSS